MEDRYVACMVLSGVGGALGCKGGKWESCKSGEQIHEEVKGMGGVGLIEVTPQDWPVNCGTVMHIATAKALVKDNKTDEELCVSLDMAYKESVNEIAGRSPDPRGGGCGAAMRAMCIGLRYPNKQDIDNLIKVSVEAGRITHNHPTGYLGSFAAALFTSYSIQGKPIREWGKEMMGLLPRVQEYVKHVNVDVKEHLQAWDYFKIQWEAYLKARGITEGNSDPIFPKVYGIKERDEFYKGLSFASGHDAPMIAYDAFLGYDGTWEDLCSRSMFHGGDSDVTGVIAAAWYGAMFGFKRVPKPNHKNLEKRKELMELAQKIYSSIIPIIPQQDYESPTYIIRKSALVNIFTLDKAGSKYQRNNDVDYESLYDFFRRRFRLPPAIVKHGNATYSEITACIERIDGTKHDAFFFIFLSFLDENKSTKGDTTGSLSVKCHRGESRGPVQVSILPAELIGMVKKNQSLALKPKIFIFQADDNSILPTKMISKGKTTSDVKVTSRKIPTDADQLVIISTLPQKLANLFETEAQLPASSDKGVHAQPSEDGKSKRQNSTLQQPLKNPSLLISAMIKILGSNNDKDVFECTPLINGEVMRIIETLHIDMNDVPGGELPVPLVYSTLTKCLNFFNERDYESGL
ncbi:inactive ADP-ribosyltransferase arh2-like [Dreissena polymorpha]|uniref:inactive ADP-ribosyltransferase arh2-like n=1 Tax=Dreissena polymorpha TaxID=45954 RepID=UPI002264B65B|nr:inactive ADP-ribosyltransferase arh2-like [Dreissena polymorpha]